MKVLLFVLALISMLTMTAFGQGLPSAEMGSGVLASMASVDQALSGHLGGIVTTVLGILLMFVSKMVSTEKSTGVIDKVQKVFDFAAKLLMGMGSLLKKLSDILAKAVASDGYMGKK